MSATAHGPYKTLRGRISRQTVFYEPDHSEAPFADDFGADDHDDGMFDEKDPTFKGPIYSKYRYDRMSNDGNDTGEDTASGLERQLSRQLSRLSVGGGRDTDDDEDTETDETDSNLSFVTQDGGIGSWTSGSYVATDTEDGDDDELYDANVDRTDDSDGDDGSDSDDGAAA